MVLMEEIEYALTHGDIAGAIESAKVVSAAGNLAAVQAVLPRVLGYAKEAGAHEQHREAMALNMMVKLQVEGTQDLRFSELRQNLEVVRKVVAAGDRSAAQSLLFRFLEACSAADGNAQHYCDALALCVELDAKLDAPLFARLLLRLTAQVPVPEALVRLTLNLAVPRSGQVVALSPSHCHEELNETDSNLDPSLQNADAVQFIAKKVAPADLRGRLQVDGSGGAYFCHFVVLLHLQFLAEITNAERRMREGHGANVEFQEVSSTLAVLKVPEADLRRCRLRLGDFVRIWPAHGCAEGAVAREGFVKELPEAEGRSWQSHGLVVVKADFQAWSRPCGSWRLDAAPNRTAYEREFHALLRMVTAQPGERLPLWDLLATAGTFGSASGQVPSQGRRSGDRSAELHRFAEDEPVLSASRTQALQGARARLQGHEDVDGLGMNLNFSQRAAVAACLGRRLTLVQGPPGTGKTHVSAHLLELWVRQLRLRPILVTSHSNTAVDNIAECAQKRGLNVVRVGRPDRISDLLEDITYDSLFQRQRDLHAKEALQVASGKPGAGSVESVARAAVLAEADVVCATTTSTGRGLLDGVEFAAILMDEAAQATELSALVPIVLCGAERLVLVGDQCQLAPVISSSEAAARGLSLSLFDRLATQGVKPCFLTTQFRMHPKIAEYSSRTFYNGRLLTGIDERARLPPTGFAWPRRGCGVAFLQHRGAEQRERDSYSNPDEAARLVDVLAGVLAAGELSCRDVGVITPYAAQVVALLQCLGRELPLRLGTAWANGAAAGGTQPGQQPLPDVGSVDAFQGRERELILFSAVRSNPQGSVGFLADTRRLNVLLTRARRGLIVIGDATTLRQDPAWAGWLRWAEDEGLCVGDLGEERRP